MDELLTEDDGTEHDGWHLLQPRTAKDTKVSGSVRLHTLVTPLGGAESSAMHGHEQHGASSGDEWDEADGSGEGSGCGGARC